MKSIDLWAANMTGRSGFAVEELDHDDESSEVADALEDFLEGVYREKEATLGEAMMKPLSSQVMLRIIDTRWMAHLQEMDYLKTGIGLRAFGQRDPLTEYREEAYAAFENLTNTMYDDFLRTILRLEVAKSAPAPEAINADDPLARKMSYSSPEQALEASGTARRSASAPAGGAGAGAPRPAQAKPHTYVKDKDDPYATAKRNDPCPCGSGKKFKNCHGR